MEFPPTNPSVEPFGSPSPPRRGPRVLVTLLAVGFLIASTIAAVEYVQLRSARERIEELEAAGGDGGGNPGGDLFGDLQETIEELLGGTGDLFGQATGALECALAGVPGTGSGEAASDVQGIADQVEGLRELQFREEVEPSFMTSEETSGRVRELFLEEYTPELADIEERILTSLGAIEPGTDLRALRSRALGGQVAGFYEPETGEIVIRQGGPEPSATDRITLAHELDHALTDQVLEIPLPDDPVIGEEDANTATLALVEGDATLVMQRYSATLPLEATAELLDPQAIAEAEAGLEGVPPYLERELIFPYEEGLSFVCGLWAEGGWEAVNDAYARPPTTTAQVLFPERYADGEEALDPRDPGALGKDWRSAAKLQLGAANLLWLFEAPGGDPRDALDAPRDAAAAWGGGELQLWSRGSDTAVGVVLSEREGSDRLCGSIEEWYRRSFPGGTEAGPAGARAFDGSLQDTVIRCSADEVRLGIAPDLATAGKLVV